MDKYFLDTNFIYSLLNSEDINHSKAVNVFSQFSKYDSNLFTSKVNLVELICSGDVLNYKNIFEDLRIEVIDFDNSEIKYIEKKISLIEKRKLKAVDCIILSIVLVNDFELVTFDKNLSKVYLKHIKV